MNSQLNINKNTPELFFSVIIPAYNAAHLITQTIDSVYAQSFTNYEIIIVNDGSTDNTSEVLDKYRQKEGVVVIDQKNKGEGGARNKGIFTAKGFYLAFLDQDDLWFPWTLQTYYDSLNESGYPNVLIATGQEFREVDEIDNMIYQQVETVLCDSFFSAAKDKYMPAGTPGTVVKTSAARKVGGLSEERVIGIDMEFYWKIGEVKGVIHLLKPTTVAIRRHEGNLQGNIGMAVKGVLLFIEKERQQCYPGGDKLAVTRKKIISRMTRNTSIGALDDGFFSDALRIYYLTLRWNIRLYRFRYLIAFPFISLYKFLINHRK